MKKLIAGPTVYICNECIGLCNDIIAEEIDRGLGEEATALPDPSKPLPLPKIGIWPLPKSPLRLVEFIRSDNVRVVLNPRYVAGFVPASPNGGDPLTRISMIGIEGVVEVEGTLDSVREKLTK